MNTGSEIALNAIEHAVISASPLQANHIIGISGIDGAGKSTVAEQLCARLRHRLVRTYLIEIDSFIRPRSERNANHDQAVGYYEDTFDFPTIFDQLVRPLRDFTVFSRTFNLVDWPSDEYRERQFHIEGPACIVVEGVFLFRRPYVDLFDLRVWLDIPFHASLKRAQARRRDQEYYGSADLIAHRYQSRFYPGQRLHFDRDEPKAAADLVFSISDSENVG